MAILHKDNNGVIKEYTAGNSIYNLNYSTEEIDTGKIWIDGKKIYRKVFETTTFSNFTIGENRTVINMSGYGYDSTPNSVNIPYYHTSSDYIHLWFTQSTGTVNIEKRGSLVKGYIVIEYTKTTD